MTTRQMVFCRHCAKEIHVSAPACPQCGGVQSDGHTAAPGAPGLWMPITALVCTILGVLACLDTSSWDTDTTVGVGIMGVLGGVFGIISLRTQPQGQKMAIAAIVMAAIVLLVLLGTFA